MGLPLRQDEREPGAPKRADGAVLELAALDHARTLDRSLVHRWSVAEVFLTGLRCDDPGRVEATAQWPRQHAYFDTGDGAHCLLLGAETFRQTAIGALHALGLAAPSDSFVMRRMGVGWAGEPPTVSDRPLDLCVRLTMTPAARAGRFDLGVTLAAGDRELVTGSGAVVVLGPQVYRALRAGRVQPGTRVDATSGIRPEAVGRTRQRDVVLAGQGRRSWDLRVDTSHPTFFDHPSDHLPGMLLFEAARQAAMLRSGGRRVRSITGDFDAYLEVDTPTTVELTSQDGDLTTTIRQGETVGARFQVLLSP